jgi:hypothetical protein
MLSFAWVWTPELVEYAQHIEREKMRSGRK